MRKYRVNISAPENAYTLTRTMSIGIADPSDAGAVMRNLMVRVKSMFGNGSTITKCQAV